jgi:hypothetical protein
LLTGAAMISKEWRERLIFLAMSLFVAWHTFAMLVAPNSSATAQSLRTVLQPYLSLFRLDSNWAFFAPSAGKHSQFRYVVTDADGREHTFLPGQQVNWYLPTDMWFKNWYYTIIESPEIFSDFFAAMACREHAALKPASVTLLAIQEQDFSPEDHLRGKHPLDPEFIAVVTLKHVACPTEPGSQK